MMERKIMTPSGKKTAIAVAALATTAIVGLWASSGFGQNLAAGPFNAAQVDAGRTAYVGNCLVCHGDTMSGNGEAPAIAGKGFMVSWGGQTAKDLFDTIKGQMPYGAAGSLSDETYANLVAFLLHANGARTGTTAFTPTNTVRISSVASGTIPAEVTAGLKPVQTAQAAPAPAAPAAAAPAAGAAAADAGGNGNAGAAARAGLPRAEGAGGGFRTNTSLGVVKAGTIANYQLVTDDMLTNPPAKDWLMYRGNYSGWSYSKLGQITPANVGQLQLKWTMAMNDGGTNETTPLVHNGVIFLLSSGNTVQAINAVTGELIWQNNIGPAPRNLEPGGSSDETRAIGLYNDKVIVPTPQGRIYGLDAKTGKVDWQSWISDPAKPDEGQHGNTGGVIIAHGKAIVGMVNCGRIPQTAHCNISAYDANTGQRAWKFTTVALTGQPGGDSWGKLPDDQRAGTET
jgi:alcohol dehydrogenase (cytochrome c)